MTDFSKVMEWMESYNIWLEGMEDRIDQVEARLSEIDELENRIIRLEEKLEIIKQFALTNRTESDRIR